MTESVGAKVRWAKFEVSIIQLNPHNLQPKLGVKYDWYQTEAAVVITVMVKNVKEEQLLVNIGEKQVNVLITEPEYEICDLTYNLSQKIDPSQSSYKLSATKV